MTSGKRPPADELVWIKRAIVARQGLTTAPGNIAGTTMFDAGLIGAGANSYENMLVVINPDDHLLVDSVGVDAFNTLTGQLTLNEAYKGGQIGANVRYVIVGFRFTAVDVAALMADVGNASISVLGSIYGILGDPATSISDTLAALAAAGGYFEQNLGILMNSTQTLTNVAGDKDFIATNTTGASGLISTVDAKVQRVMLVIIGLAVNTYDGDNALDCTTAAHNQWKMNLDGGAWTDLTNEEADGQMLDNDWLCLGKGAVHPFVFEFNVTAQVTNIDGKIGLRLENGRAEQDGLKVTLASFLKVLYKL